MRISFGFFVKFGLAICFLFPPVIQANTLKNVDDYISAIVAKDYESFSKLCANDGFIQSLNKSEKNKINKNSCLERLNDQKMYDTFYLLTKINLTAEELFLLSKLMEINNLKSDYLNDEDLKKLKKEELAKFANSAEFIEYVKYNKGLLTKLYNLNKQKTLAFYNLE